MNAEILSCIGSVIEVYVGTLVAAALSIHALRTAWFLLGAHTERGNITRSRSLSRDVSRINTTSSEPFVSVIVPARNEEATIERCIRALMANAYSHYEVLVVNDRSTDRTGEVLSYLQAEFPSLRVHNAIDDTSNPNLKGKPRALHQGIERSSGTIVMMTDADCAVEPTWIAATVEVFADASVGLVPSFTVTTENTAFARIQALEWAINNTMAMAGIGWKQPLGCFGNNLAVRRSVYDALGGYPRIAFSLTEDLALLQAVSKTSWQVRYICDHRTKAVTLPCETAGEFIKQHRRWVLGGKALGGRAALFVGSSVLMWAAIAAVAVAGRLDLVGLLAVVRMLLDFSIVWPTLQELDLTRLTWWFPLAMPFFQVLELMAPFFILKPTVEWKGQIMR
jgi:cellulose synthase/poly-beta-1,6-N-acetylglucosamine synthase-like glycosyltransferase